MNPYLHFVSEYARLAKAGRAWPLGGFPRCPRPEVAPDAPVALIFSPHPDDEVIIGGLALRLLREAKWNVINVAVTQGSNKVRQAGRWAELQACCDCIGFGLVPTQRGGLEKVNLATRERDRAHWAASVQIIAQILLRHRPAAIFFPHEADWNSSRFTGCGGGMVASWRRSTRADVISPAAKTQPSCFGPELTGTLCAARARHWLGLVACFQA
ncbi:MAG: hypothetical protein EB082_17785 [Verrucomicrobia bacterium]|nr:hypothetical protein [Verrucomicrobiota bacterium]